MCEQVALSLQAILASNAFQGKLAVIQTDVHNAFNTVSRTAIMEALGTHADHLLPWTQASLKPSALFLSESVLVSLEGGQPLGGQEKGDPLSSQFLALAIQRDIRSCPRTLAYFWYLDDGTLISGIGSLRECMRHLVQCLAAVGRILDMAKKTLMGPSSPTSPLPRIPRHLRPSFWSPHRPF
jgi:hypothetical protein